eukprot:CAMPEP_0181457104 /NCGR_PEP_ID=MMETSP1110-20121109/31618_1 /TAXON_ID=174948 /ORGANISM="Symbiodinium sp., Strain CCMP421" /LENGTH=99 /DNA_ID=CAMNT_0023581543 /DNA_START=249 /DNA_END=548 /DNA_ORIENTATION=+
MSFPIGSVVEVAMEREAWNDRGGHLDFDLLLAPAELLPSIHDAAGAHGDLLLISGEIQEFFHHIVWRGGHISNGQPFASSGVFLLAKDQLSLFQRLLLT